MVREEGNAPSLRAPRARLLLLYDSLIMAVAIGVEPISLVFQSIAMTASAKQPYGHAYRFRPGVAAVKVRFPNY